jgi:hypothetical protein
MNCCLKCLGTHEVKRYKPLKPKAETWHSILDMLYIVRARIEMSWTLKLLSSTSGINISFVDQRSIGGLKTTTNTINQARDIASIVATKGQQRR